MNKPFLIFVVGTVPIVAQIPSSTNSFLQSGWLRMANPGATTLIPSSIDGQSGPILGRPVSANEIRHTEQTLSDCSHINRTETEHFYRDSMGRMRTETDTGAIIFDPVAGFTYDLTTSRKTYSRSAISPTAVYTIAAAAHRSSISSGSGQDKQKPERAFVTEDLPPQTQNGFYAKGVRMTITIPAGAIGNEHDLKVVNERWFSDDLELLVKTSNSDPRFGTSTYELTNVSQIPPDPALFQVPMGFSEAH